MRVRDKQQKIPNEHGKKAVKDTSDTAREALAQEYQDGSDVSTRKRAGTVRKVTFPEQSWALKEEIFLMERYFE